MESNLSLRVAGAVPVAFTVGGEPNAGVSMGVAPGAPRSRGYHSRAFRPAFLCPHTLTPVRSITPGFPPRAIKC